MVTTDADSIKEVRTRITKARQAFAALKNLFMEVYKNKPKDQIQNFQEQCTEYPTIWK
jgi:BioD-like phosphotransacetylase family protein